MQMVLEEAEVLRIYSEMLPLHCRKDGIDMVVAAMTSADQDKVKSFGFAGICASLLQM